MRHRVTGSKLGRTASHRRATLSALSTSLIEHKRIRTTLAKAKATQRTIEPIITRAKLAYQKETGGDTKDIHARRMVARFIKNPSIVKELFDEVAPKVVERNGGYTRVVKLGQRDGDGAQLAIIELVDYNEAVTKKAKQKKKAEKAAAAEKAKKKEEKKETEETAEKADVVAQEDEPKQTSKASSKKVPKTKTRAKPEDAGEKAQDEESSDKEIK
jgi:large subunit ribosomal protein L17